MRSMRVLFIMGVIVFAAAQLSATTHHFYVASGGGGTTCTFAAPCATWAAAIANVANGDEITAITSGDFGSIDLEAGQGVIIDGGGTDAGLLDGTVIVHLADGESATLRGLDINGAGTSSGSKGITFSGGSSLVIEDCEVQNYQLRGISIESATNGAKVLITNTIVLGQANNGIVVVPPTGKANSVLIDHVRVVHNTNAGIGVNPRSIVEIRDSVISNNGTFGVLATGPSAPVSVESSSVSNNGTGVAADSGGVVRLANVNVWNNGVGLAVSSGTIGSFGNNSLTGNVISGPAPTPLSLQ